MRLITASLKTLGEKINQKIYQRQIRIARNNAYSVACEKANGKFDTNWHKNYKKQLKVNQQKAKDKKDLRSTFLSNL